jgi:hypothetical protein
MKKCQLTDFTAGFNTEARPFHTPSPLALDYHGEAAAYFWGCIVSIQKMMKMP